MSLTVSRRRFLSSLTAVVVGGPFCMVLDRPKWYSVPGIAHKNMVVSLPNGVVGEYVVISSVGDGDVLVIPPFGEKSGKLSLSHTVPLERGETKTLISNGEEWILISTIQD